MKINKRIRNQDSSLEGSWRANMRVVLDTAESWYNDQTFQSDLSSLHTYKRQYREGVLYPNGTPLQYSCLEKPMDRGAWWAVVHRVTKSRARLSDFTFTFHFHALEIRSDQISHSVVSDSLRPHESQHARPPCPSPTPGVHSDSRPSSQWCHPVNIFNHLQIYNLVSFNTFALFNHPYYPFLTHFINPRWNCIH